ncbi:MAG: acyltransferase [Bacteroidetes bacterium]|nr:acyltransferase [Bacteroidota bacterium]MBU1580983.1 acyltransferase [Bacteroidota bacterium]
MKKIIKALIRYISTQIAKQQIQQYGNDLKVNFPCTFTNKTTIGDNCNFNGIHISGLGKVKIGNNFHSGKDCIIMTSFHNYDEGTKIPYDNTYISKDVTIADNVWLGHRVIILGGVSISEGAIIQAGSVVVSNIPYCSIAGGHPAKVFKYRNIEHYESLKRQKQFN